VRRTGPFAITPDLRRVLAQARHARGIVTPPELLLDSVQDVERALGGAIPDPLLAVCAATGRSLGTLVDLTRMVGAYYDANRTRDWKRTTGFAHVAFDGDYSDEGPLCTPLGGSAEIVWWFLRKGSGSLPTFVVEGEAPFVSYVRWKYGIAGDAPEAGGELYPRLVVPAPVAKPERRVRHAVFGDGRVVEEIPPDKLLVDFGANGVKKLLTRVLTPID